MTSVCHCFSPAITWTVYSLLQKVVAFILSLANDVRDLSRRAGAVCASKRKIGWISVIFEFLLVNTVVAYGCFEAQLLGRLKRRAHCLLCL